MKKILLLAAVFAVMAPVAASAEMPPVVLSEKGQVARAAECLGFAVRSNSSLVVDRFSTSTETVNGMTWVLSNKARLVTISMSGRCTTGAIAGNQLQVKPIGIAYIPNPPMGNVQLIEIQVNPDGSRVFTDGK